MCARKAAQPTRMSQAEKISRTLLSDEELAALRAQGAKQHRGMITPELDIAAVRASWELPFARGQAFEEALSDGSLGTPESKAMRHLFFAQREAGKIPGLRKASW